MRGVIATHALEAGLLMRTVHCRRLRRIRKQSKSRYINRLKKCPTIRLRTEGLGFFAEHLRRNIRFLRCSCRLAFRNPKIHTTFLLRSPKTEKERSLTIVID